MEGKDAWAKRQVGWNFELGGVQITAYHFWLTMMFIILLSLPLVVVGWDRHLFGVLLTAGLLGVVLEDFLWFVVNPYFGLKKWNPDDAPWYPWLRIGKVAIPLMYILSVCWRVCRMVFFVVNKILFFFSKFSVLFLLFYNVLPKKSYIRSMICVVFFPFSGFINGDNPR